MKRLLLIVWVLAIATSVLSNFISWPNVTIGILAVLATVGGYFAGAKLKEDIGVCAFVGASVVFFSHILTNGFLVLFHTFLGLHLKQEESGTAYLFGALIFSAIMPATILGGLGGISGYIGRRFSGSKY